MVERSTRLPELDMHAAHGIYIEEIADKLLGHGFRDLRESCRTVGSHCRGGSPANGGCGIVLLRRKRSGDKKQWNQALQFVTTVA